MYSERNNKKHCKQTKPRTACETISIRVTPEEKERLYRISGALHADRDLQAPSLAGRAEGDPRLRVLETQRRAQRYPRGHHGRQHRL